MSLSPSSNNYINTQRTSFALFTRERLNYECKFIGLIIYLWFLNENAICTNISIVLFFVFINLEKKFTLFRKLFPHQEVHLTLYLITTLFIRVNMQCCLHCLILDINLANLKSIPSKNVTFENILTMSLNPPKR